MADHSTRFASLPAPENVLCSAFRQRWSNAEWIWLSVPYNWLKTVEVILPPSFCCLATVIETDGRINWLSLLEAPSGGMKFTGHKAENHIPIVWCGSGWRCVAIVLRCFCGQDRIFQLIFFTVFAFWICFESLFFLRHYYWAAWPLRGCTIV